MLLQPHHPVRVTTGAPRREFLRQMFWTAGALGAAVALPGTVAASSASARSGQLPPLGPLQAPDANGVRLPAGFTSRVVARAGDRPVRGSLYRWHGLPDGRRLYFSSQRGGPLKLGITYEVMLPAV